MAHMTPFLFVAWFLDQSMPVGDQDREWVACFYVIASNAEAAKNWGDTVANAYALKRPELQFFQSYIQDEEDGRGGCDIPTIAHGEMPTDEQIGW